MAPRRRSPWSSSTGDVAGRKNKDLKFQRFSAQLKRKPWEARKAAFKQGSLWNSSDGVMSRGAVGVKPHWRPQKKSSDPSVFKHQPQKAASGRTHNPLEVATIHLPPHLAAARVEQTGAWRSPSRLQVTSGSIPEVETPQRVVHAEARLSQHVQTERCSVPYPWQYTLRMTGTRWPQKHQDYREGELENWD